METLIEKQIALMADMQELLNTITALEDGELLLYTRDRGQIVPIASERLQSLILTDTISNEITQAVVESLELCITQLSALGLDVNSNARQEFGLDQPTIS